MKHTMEIPLKTKNKTSPYDPAFPLLGLYPEKDKIEKDTCTPLLIVALFAITRTYMKHRCPSTDEWIKELWYIYTVEYSVQFSG